MREAGPAHNSACDQGLLSAESVPHDQVEGMRGTREGDEASRRYNAQLALHTLRFAINGNLRAPPAGFEDAIRIHFRLLRWRILRQVGAASVCSHFTAASVGMHGELPGTLAGA